MRLLLLIVTPAASAPATAHPASTTLQESSTGLLTDIGSQRFIGTFRRFCFRACFRFAVFFLQFARKDGHRRVVGAAFGQEALNQTGGLFIHRLVYGWSLFFFLLLLWFGSR